jgi:hypothetical protein
MSVACSTEIESSPSRFVAVELGAQTAPDSSGQRVHAEVALECRIPYQRFSIELEAGNSVAEVFDRVGAAARTCERIDFSFLRTSGGNDAKYFRTCSPTDFTAQSRE